MEVEFWTVLIGVSGGLFSAAAIIGGAAWYMGGKINSLTARMDGMEKHFGARMDGLERHFDSRLGKLESEVHDIRADIRSINEYLRRPA